MKPCYYQQFSICDYKWGCDGKICKEVKDPMKGDPCPYRNITCQIEHELTCQDCMIWVEVREGKFESYKSSKEKKEELTKPLK